MFQVTVRMLQTGKEIEYEAVSYYADEDSLYIELPNGSAIIDLDTIEGDIVVREMEEIV